MDPFPRLLAAGWALLNLPAVFLPDSVVSFLAWPLLVQVVLISAWAGSGLYAQLYWYVYISSPLQRQQTKWAVLGLALAVLGPFAYFLPSAILPAIEVDAMPNLLYNRVGSGMFTFSLVFRVAASTAFAAVLLLFPFTFAISILRYRLWDIGVVVNRTLVYAALTAALAIFYVLSIVLLQTAFRGVTGQDESVALVISTLAIAALFQPMRRRFQGLIDRRFYRSKYDAAQTLATFSAQMRDEVDLDTLSSALVDVVDETMRPARVTLWFATQSREGAKTQRP